MKDKTTLWDLGLSKIECNDCGVNCDLYLDDNDNVFCKECAQKIEIEFDDVDDQ